MTAKSSSAVNSQFPNSKAVFFCAPLGRCRNVVEECYFFSLFFRPDGHSTEAVRVPRSRTFLERADLPLFWFFRFVSEEQEKGQRFARSIALSSMKGADFQTATMMTTTTTMMMMMKMATVDEREENEREKKKKEQQKATASAST